MQHNFKWQTPNWLRVLCLTLLVGLAGAGAKAALINTYTFVPSTGTYTSISGTTSTATGDDGTQTGIPLGFTFNYNSTAYTTIAITTNGAASFSGTGPSWTNGLNPSPLATTLAPFWDDHNQTGGTIQYTTTGTAPNRVFTVQWANIHIGGSGSSANPTGSFQMKLYETSNQVQFVYGTFAAMSGVSASIGLTGASGNFISVTPGAPPTASIVTANNAIAANTFLPSGTIYTFAPPTVLPCSGTPAPGNTLANATPTTLSVCSGSTVNFSLQTLTSGSGVTYQSVSYTHLTLPTNREV